MDDVARMSAKDRADLFIQTGTGRGLTTQMIEKDFWVCWALKRVFTMPSPPAGLLFKGGTSLSKVFKVIDRFSEDVDLSFNRADLGFKDGNDPMNQTGKQRKRTLESLTTKCQSVIHEDLLPKLLQEFERELRQKNGSTWSLTLDPDDPQAILFQYPALSPYAEQDYIRPIVRLEIGARSEHWPALDRKVSPYAADEHPKLFKNPQCEVRVLDAKRTFWEKATILHQWYHAPLNKPFPDRQSRHYYDVVKLFQHEIGKEAIKDLSLLEKVAEHKATFFPSAWARYEDAKPGTLRLVPLESRLPELRADYAKMESMIFGKVPTLAELIEVLSVIEQQINSPEGGPQATE